MCSDPRPEILRALEEHFGYAPQDGEKWCVYQDAVLIVIHPDHRPRVYERGGGGEFMELEPICRGVYL